MAKWRQRAGLLTVGTIAAVSVAACSPGSPSRADGSSSSLDDDTSVSVDSDSQGINSAAIAIACGDFSTLGLDAPFLDGDGQIVVPNSQVTVSISADNHKRVTFNGSGLVLGKNTGIVNGSSVEEGSGTIPSGNSDIGLVAGRETALAPGEQVTPDVFIHVHGDDTLTGNVYTRQDGIAPGAVYAYQPNGVPRFGAEVSVALDSGVAQVALKGNLIDGAGLDKGEPFLRAIPITPEILGSQKDKSNYDMSLNARADVGTVVVVAASNAPISDRGAPMLTCASLAVKTSAANVAAR